MIKHPPSDCYSIVPSSLQPPPRDFQRDVGLRITAGSRRSSLQRGAHCTWHWPEKLRPGVKNVLRWHPLLMEPSWKNIHVISWIGKIPFPEFSEALIIRNLHGLEKVVVLVLFFLVSESRGAGSTLWPQWPVSFHLHIFIYLQSLDVFSRWLVAREHQQENQSTHPT